MAFLLIVETGEGLEDSNSYVSIADADTILELEGSPTWVAADDTVKSKALGLSTLVLDRQLDWTGEAQNVDQALGWPRLGSFNYNKPRVPHHASASVPEGVKKATAYLADRIVSGAWSVAELEKGSEGTVASIDLPDLRMSRTKGGKSSDKSFGPSRLPYVIVQYLKAYSYNALSKNIL